ncbi:MAG: sirohydrochlorin chelatase [Alphaproteobacteria bacterium]
MIQPASHTSALLVFHGSSTRPENPQIAAFQEGAEQALFPLTVAAAFLEAQEPDIPTQLQNLRDGGAKRIVVQPVMLTAAQHVTQDIPDILAAWDGTIAYGKALRGGAATAAALSARVQNAITPAHDGLVIWARATKDKMAMGEAHRLAELLGTQHRLPAIASFAGRSQPPLPQVIAEIGAKNPLIAPHVLLDGAVSDAAHASGFTVAATLGAHPALIEDIAARIRALIDTFPDASVAP